MTGAPFEFKVMGAVDPLLAEANRQIANQIDRLKQIEGKANILTAFAGLVATSLVGLKAHPFLLWVCWVCAGMTIVLGWYVLLPMNFKFGPELAWLRDNRLDVEADRAKVTLIDTAINTFDHNAPLLEKKADVLEAELCFFIITIALIIAAKVTAG